VVRQVTLDRGGGGGLIDKSSGSSVWRATRLAAVDGTRSNKERTEQALRGLLINHTTAALVRVFFEGIAKPHCMVAERTDTRRRCR
jgi:hypothetical protein